MAKPIKPIEGEQLSLDFRVGAEAAPPPAISSHRATPGHHALALAQRERLEIATHPTRGTGYALYWPGAAQPCGCSVQGRYWCWDADWRIVSPALAE
jgi:hypothetical protein